MGGATSASASSSDAAAPYIGTLILNGILAGDRDHHRLPALIVPGLILITIWAVIAPSIVVEDQGVIEAFGRSRELVRGNGWNVFGAIVLAFLIVLRAVSIVLGRARRRIGDAPAAVVLAGDRQRARPRRSRRSSRASSSSISAAARRHLMPGLRPPSRADPPRRRPSRSAGGALARAVGELAEQLVERLDLLLAEHGAQPAIDVLDVAGGGFPQLRQPIVGENRIAHPRV